MTGHIQQKLGLMGKLTCNIQKWHFGCFFINTIAETTLVGIVAVPGEMSDGRSLPGRTGTHPFVLLATRHSFHLH
ncbi:MAG: hypothetical protein ABFD82_12625 [Syntrophaceae bacterium]